MSLSRHRLSRAYHSDGVGERCARDDSLVKVWGVSGEREGGGDDRGDITNWHPWRTVRQLKQTDTQVMQVNIIEQYPFAYHGMVKEWTLFKTHLKIVVSQNLPTQTLMSTHFFIPSSPSSPSTSPESLSCEWWTHTQQLSNHDHVPTAEAQQSSLLHYTSPHNTNFTIVQLTYVLCQHQCTCVYTNKLQCKTRH